MLNKYNLLYAIPVFIVILGICFGYTMSFAQMPAFIPLDYDYMIYKNGNYTISINGTNGNADYNDTDSGFVIQQTINTMKTGQTMFIKSGNYVLTSDLNVNKSISISGGSVGTGPTFSGVKITTNNHSIVFSGSFIDWNYIWIHGGKNNNKDVAKLIGTSEFHSKYMKITACSTCIGLHFAGDATHYNSWFNIENLDITNSNVAVRFDSTTQGHIGYSQLSAWYQNAIIFNQTDNISFTHLNISTPQTGAGAGILFGTSSTTKAWAEHFDYLAIMTQQGQPGFIVNFALTTWPATTINHYLGQAPVYNNNSTHGTLIYFDALSKTWKGN